MPMQNFNKKTSTFIAQVRNKETISTNKTGRQQAMSTPNHLENFSDEKRIKENLILAALDQMVTQIDDKVTVSKALEQNKFIWAKAMFKTKSLQELLANFSY